MWDYQVAEGCFVIVRSGVGGNIMEGYHHPSKGKGYAFAIPERFATGHSVSESEILNHIRITGGGYIKATLRKVCLPADEARLVRASADAGRLELTIAMSNTVSYNGHFSSFEEQTKVVGGTWSGWGAKGKLTSDGVVIQVDAGFPTD